MAHQYPFEEERRADAEEDVHAPPPPPPHAMYRYPHLQHSQRQQQYDEHQQQGMDQTALYPVARSNPIAIRRRDRNTAARHPDTSDDDDEDDYYTGNSDVEDLERELQAMEFTTDPSNTSGRIRIRPFPHEAPSQSLPSRLLRAPRLGSIPTNDDSLAYQHMLPPPMSLSTADAPLSTTTTGRAEQTSYGSLRDSHVRGRFLDGPSSYRDRRTGDIRLVQQRVRFHEQQQPQQASSLQPTLSIGERIMRSRQQQQQTTATKQEETAGTTPSSLSTLLQGSNSVDQKPASRPESTTGVGLLSAAISGEPQQQPPPPPQSYPNTTFYDQDSAFDDADQSERMSTSLTGLEILQRQKRREVGPPPMQLQRPPAPTSVFRDETNGTSLLSRSLSDPSPGLFPSGAAATAAASASMFLPPRAQAGTQPGRSLLASSLEAPMDPNTMPLSSNNAPSSLFPVASLPPHAGSSYPSSFLVGPPASHPATTATVLATRTSAEALDDNPDTEEAFHLDFE